MRGRFVVAAVLSLSLSGCGWMVDLWGEHPVFGMFFAHSEKWPEGWEIENSRAVREYFALSRSCGSVPGAPDGAAVSMRDYWIAEAKDDLERYGQIWYIHAYTEFSSPQGALVVIERHFANGIRRSVVKLTDFNVSLSVPSSPIDQSLILLESSMGSAFVISDLCRKKYKITDEQVRAALAPGEQLQEALHQEARRKECARQKGKRSTPRTYEMPNGGRFVTIGESEHEAVFLRKNPGAKLLGGSPCAATVTTQQ